MSSFALISEGLTDQVALESILYGHYQDPDLEFKNLQPLRDETDEARQGSFGGWEKVLEYCEDHEKITEALAFNKYLVIQIDTDVAELPKFDVRKTGDGGVEKSVDILVEDVIRKINEKLGDKIIEIYRGRIFYAICVYSLECWIIPLCSNPNLKEKTKSCEAALQNILAKSNKKYEKSYDCYLSISKGFEKKDGIKLAARKSRSLDIFINSLPDITTHSSD